MTIETVATHTPREQRYWEDLGWVREHHSEVYRQYGDHDTVVWIAVYNQQIVAHGLDPHEVERLAAEKTGRPAGEIFVTFLVGASMIL